MSTMEWNGSGSPQILSSLFFLSFLSFFHMLMVATKSIFHSLSPAAGLLQEETVVLGQWRGIEAHQSFPGSLEPERCGFEFQL